MSTLCNTKITSFKIVAVIEWSYRWTRSCSLFQHQHQQQQQQQIILIHNKKHKQQQQITSRNITINFNNDNNNNNNNKINNNNNSSLSNNSTKLLNYKQQKQQKQQQQHRQFYATALASTFCKHFAASSSYSSCSNLNKYLNLHRQQQFSIFHKYKKIMDAPAGLFRGSVDRFNGITIESAIEHENNIDFANKLEKSLNYWIETKRRGIWFKISTEHCEWIPHLVKHEFEFHHAKEGYVVMYRWLPKHESSNIPVYAHTMVGVGGLVITDNDEVLVVSDRYAMIPGSWKLPGGFVEPREDLIDAAKREVMEETGIDCSFKTLISIRHTHGVGFGCSDFYVVVALKPKSLDLTRCDREILKCQWMPIKEFLTHPHVHETNRHFMRTFLDYRKNNIKMICEKGKHQVLKKDYSLYFMKTDETAIQEHQNDETKILPIEEANKSLKNVKK